MALTKSQREQRSVNEAELRRRQQQLGHRSEWVSPCGKHPEWKTDVSDQRIAPPPSACPMCVEAELARRHPDPAPVRKLDPASAGLENDLRYELWRQRHPSGQVESGSFEEDDALQAIAEARYQEEAKEAARDARRGVLVSARPIDGRWVETRRLGNRYISTGPES